LVARKAVHQYIEGYQTVAIRGEEEFWNVFAGELTSSLGPRHLFVLPFRAGSSERFVSLRERKEMAAMIGREKMEVRAKAH